MAEETGYAAPALSYRGLKAAQCAELYPEPTAPAKAMLKKAKKAKAAKPEPEEAPDDTGEVTEGAVTEALPETGLEEDNGDTTEA